jgi:hypothetical protein
MRLNNYITEETKKLDELEPDQFVKLIARNCKKYLKLLGNNHPLYKGLSLSGSLAGMKEVRQDRHSMGTSTVTYKYVNKWLGKKGWPRRDKSVICTANESYAYDFGGAVMIFPFDMNYGYAWIEARDFNDWSFVDDKSKMPTSWDIGTLEHIIEYSAQEERFERADKYLEAFVHANKGFREAYGNMYEIWFNCKQYYYLNLNSMNQYIEKEFKKEFKRAGIRL